MYPKKSLYYEPAFFLMLCSIKSSAICRTIPKNNKCSHAGESHVIDLDKVIVNFKDIN